MFVFYCINLTFAGSTIFNGIYINSTIETGNSLIEPPEFEEKTILSFYAVSNNLSTNNITYAVRHSPTTSQGFYLKIFQTLGSESSKVCEGSSQMGEVSTCSFIYTDAMLKDEQYYAVLCSDRGDCSGKEVDLSFRDEGELIHFGTYIKFASAKVAVVNAVESNSTNNASSSLFPSSNLKSVLFSIGAIFFFLLF